MLQILSYGRARRAAVAAKLGLGVVPGPVPSESPDSLHAAAMTTLSAVASAKGFDLPEEEEEP